MRNRHQKLCAPQILSDWGRRLAESSPDISGTVKFGKGTFHIRTKCLKTLAALATLLKLEKKKNKTKKTTRGLAMIPFTYAKLLLLKKKRGENKQNPIFVPPSAPQ